MTDTDARDAAGSAGADFGSPGHQARLAELYLLTFSDAPVFEKLSLLRTEVTG